MKRAILTDIEGTTSSISFVREVLFPYARAALPRFVQEHGHKPEVRRWLACEVSTPYALYEPVRAAVAALGGVVQETQYAAAVTVCALLPEEAGEAFAAQVRDLTAGRCAVRPVGETERAVPLAGSGL